MSMVVSATADNNNAVDTPKHWNTTKNVDNTNDKKEKQTR
jgi:hypothetical protein